MNRRAERLALQAAVALACLVPLVAGGNGVLRGVAWLHGTGPTDLDSHFRYMAGIFLALGFAFVSCVPAIERRTERFQLLGLMVVAGGLARLLSWASIGAPGTGMRFGLVMELVVVPCLMAWQLALARRFRP